MKNLLDPAGTVDLNSTRLPLSVILLHLIGPQAMMIQPAFVEGLVSQLGFTASDSGYVAAAENTGKAVQSLLMMVLITRVNWRYLYYGALSVLLVGNLVCFVIESAQAFRVVRFFTGAATGTIVPLSYVIVGLTAKTERNFGFLMVSLMVYGAFVFFALPSVFSAVGFNGLIVIFAAFAISGFPVVRNMPTAGEERKDTDENAVTLSWGLRGMALAAMFTYFLATFGVWVFMSLIGKNAGLDDQTVGNAMMLTQFAGIAGALIVIGLGKRVGRAIPLALALIGSVGALYVLSGATTALGFTLGACLFNLLWNTTHPYLLSAQASFDRSGRQVSYAVALQMMGIAAGPAVGAAIVESGTYAQVIWLSMALMVVTFALIQPPVLREQSLVRRERGPIPAPQGVTE